VKEEGENRRNRNVKTRSTWRPRIHLSGEKIVHRNILLNISPVLW
jgi:hypothetical protein